MEKDRSCGEAVPVKPRTAWEDYFDGDSVQDQFGDGAVVLSDDGLGATTEEEFARGYDQGLVERRTANAQPKERRQGNRKTVDSSYICTGESAARNQKMEVGDVGLFPGNMGLRAKKGANTVVF